MASLTRTARCSTLALISVLCAACPPPAPSPDANSSDASTSEGGAEGFDPSECQRDCASMNSMLSSVQYCGTDQHTYGACDWICGEVEPGIGVFPGACQSDGTPQPNGPPAAADGEVICDWSQVASEWVPVECSDNLDDALSEVGEGSSSSTDFESTMSMTPAEVDHRNRFGDARNQGSAPTCTAFATVAALESAIARTGSRHDLSEMHLFARYRRANTTAAVAAARQAPVATRDDATASGLDYNATIARDWVTGRQTPPSAIIAQLDMSASFELASIDVLPPGPNGTPSINQIVAALASGRDVVASLYTVGEIWGRRVGPDGIVPDYDLSNRNGHAILLVGYKTLNDRRYFIFRNSYGRGWGAMGYGYISESTLAANMQRSPYFTVTVANVRGGRTAPNCPDGQAANGDGECRVLCMDGALADAMGTCGTSSVMCPDGEVADSSGSCVRACAMGMSMVDGRTVNCSPRGCLWTIPDGQDGCTNGPCDRQCPAPDCELAVTRNEMNEVVWTCRGNL